MARTVLSKVVWSLVALTTARVTACGSEAVLHSFACPPGAGPEGVIRDAAGNLYGTMGGGGAYGRGTFYKLNTSGNATVLHSFAGGNDGSVPSGMLIRDSAGNFYGVTSEGGSYGIGTVYKMDVSGHATVLYSFTGGADGGYPTSGVVRD